MILGDKEQKPSEDMWNCMLKSKDIEHPYYVARAAASTPGCRQIDWLYESVSCILWIQKEDLHTATGLVNNGHFL